MTKELVYSSAGMNTQPLLVKKNNEISEIDIRGLPVCNLIELVKAEYTDHTIQLEDKDRVFFYTDGLIELDNKKMGESFTLPHLKEFLAENNDMGCLELYEKLDKKIMSISDISGLKDDVTFFMLQVRSCSVK
jgi:sigma-B regulation protein RsbU (phosphoserine phosphatase)